jgi:ribosomal protein S18 acetylase RimI-like enzyme
MSEIAERRRLIGHLLDERQPADAMAAYFAFYHAAERTRLVTFPAGSERAQGYIALSRTGMDLFRPLLTLRLPSDLAQATTLIYEAIGSETAVILNTPDQYMPLLRACFSIQSEEQHQVMALDPNRFEPVINVLVTQETGANGRPRFVIRNRAADNEVLAAASVNWLYPHFAEVSVNTLAGQRQRGYGRSVLAALVNYLLGEGIRPLYVVRPDNAASIRLARRVGFLDTGQRSWFLQATLKPPPNQPIPPPLS